MGQGPSVLVTGPSFNMSDNLEIDPFVKRVVTVHPTDMVIFRYNGPQPLAAVKAAIEAKMGNIPCLVVGPDFDLTVLKPTVNDSDDLGFG